MIALSATQLKLILADQVVAADLVLINKIDTVYKEEVAVASFVACGLNCNADLQSVKFGNLMRIKDGSEQIILFKCNTTSALNSEHRMVPILVHGTTVPFTLHTTVARICRCY
jgi:G3E family GTPase